MNDLRYRRNIMLPEVGAEGQQKLAESRVLIVGAGGLGSPVIQYLTAAGVGTIGIFDQDLLDETNLQRQTIYQAKDIGQAKVKLAAKWISANNPQVTVHPYQDRFTVESGSRMSIEYQIIVDCTDNYQSRSDINEYCTKNKLAYVHGAVEQWQGQLFSWLPGCACYSCLFKDISPDIRPPSEYGIMGAVAGLIGTLQATEVIKIILNKGELLTNSLLTYNALKMRFHKVNFEKDRNCPFCSQK